MKTKQRPINENLMKCGCLEVVDAIGFQSSGIHNWILYSANNTDLIKYYKLLLDYILSDLKNKVYAPII